MVHVIIQYKLDDEQKKELECQLHAADHNKLNEITVGLLVSANHLVCILYTVYAEDNLSSGELERFKPEGYTK